MADSLNSPDDAALVQHLRMARAGSQDDLGEVLEWLRPRLSRFVAASMGERIRRHVSVSDVEQEVLGGAAQWLARLRPEAGPEDVCAMALHQARWALGKVYRTHDRAVGESQYAPAGFDAQPAASTEIGPVTAADNAAYLEATIYSLPEGLMEIVLGRREGSTFKEIGEDLGLGEDAVRKRFVQAAELIRKRWK